jgi:hypothetical protein
MHQFGRYWCRLEYAPIALAVLVIGIGIVSALAASF